MAKQVSAPLRPTTRSSIQEDARETLELEVWADGSLRRRSRFLRDTQARKYSDRLPPRLSRRGYLKAVEIR
jgi:hypothetical protein